MRRPSPVRLAAVLARARADHARGEVAGRRDAFQAFMAPLDVFPAWFDIVTSPSLPSVLPRGGAS